LSQDLTRERSNQKARTRAELLASAGALIAAGKRPTVEEAASAAGISKRTAYRYFTSQDHLLADAALETLRPRMDIMLASVASSDDVHARVASLAVALGRLAEEHDAELREMIRASLNGGAATGASDRPPARGGRRLDWIRTSLEPLREKISDNSFEQLTNCLAVCLGIDALMVLRDICGVSGEKAEELMVWMAMAIVEQGLNDADKERPLLADADVHPRTNI
jgi:AcrR family transcriptional regulator